MTRLKCVSLISQSARSAWSSVDTKSTFPIP
jgi:hypothetical protein